MKKISFFIFIAFCFSMTQAGAADISCSSDHYKSDSVCKPCSEITENCSSCSSAGKCLSCEYGYTLSGGKCVDRPQEVCSKGYHENFYFQECAKCSPVFTSAADCKSKTANATACVYNSTNGCYKAVCPSGYAEDGTTTSSSSSSEKTWKPGCGKCNVENCADCPTQGYIACYRCKSGYYYSFGSGRGSCKTCPANATCDGINVACKSGYYLKGSLSAGYSCQSCPANATCTNNDVTCNSGYYLTGSLSSGYSCTKCSLSNCTACSSATICTGCMSGYTLTNGKCETPKNTVSDCPADLTRSSDGCCCVAD